MHIESFRKYCLSLKHVTEEFPFGPDNLVFKVGGKMFAITDLEKTEFTVNLKCEPDRAIALREEYNEIQPGWHMNKQHWNTVSFDGDLSEELLKELILDSYQLVFNGLTRKVKEELGK